MNFRGGIVRRMSSKNPLVVDEDFLIETRARDIFRNIPMESPLSLSEDLDYFRGKITNALKIPAKMLAGPAPPYLDPAVIALSKNKNAKSFDRWQDGPRPSDLGEHEPIPDEAVNISPVVIKEEG